MLHKYWSPSVDTLALPFRFKQLVLSTVLHTAVGGVVKLSTTAWQVFVQPVIVLVTVTVYVPAPNPLIIDVDPLYHAYVTSVAVAVAVALPF